MSLETLIRQLELDSRHDLLQLHESQGMLSGLADPRLQPAVMRIAEELGLTPAVRYALARPAVATRRSGLLGSPSAHAVQLNEVLPGDALELLDESGGYSLVRALADDYLGWLPPGAVVPGTYEATHTVTALRAHAFAGPRVQAVKLLELSWGTQLRVVGQPAGDFSQVLLPDSQTAFVYTAALTEGIPEPVTDISEAARSLLHAPYVWGGNTAWGLDCSGLTQLVHAMAGRQLPRDSDEQFAAGERIELEDAQVGDAVCYRGHIGVIVGPETMVHATATGMRVREEHVFVREGLREAYLGTVRFG